MSPYAIEIFSDEETRLLSRHCTNLDRPVFGLVDLPEVTKGALFARYSRSSKSLRRLLLDEFAAETASEAQRVESPSSRSAELYERVLGEYGDDSVAQLGGVHVACEQVSNLLTKLIERGRLAAYLEQSTRYVPYDIRMPDGHYRYYRDPAVLGSSLGAHYVAELDAAFETYSSCLPKLSAYIAGRVPCPSGSSEVAWRRSVRSAALDALRGLLPAATLSNVGIFASGQAFEHLLLRLGSSDLPEARSYGNMLLEELRKVAPSFFSRVDKPDRGVRWARYLAESHRALATACAELSAGLEHDRSEEVSSSPAVSLVDHDPEGELKVAAAMIFEGSALSDSAALALARSLTPSQSQDLFSAYVGQRSNRRERPGRAFERTSYRFEVVSDYGTFRDLQRHRLCTIEWQPLSSRLGYDVPHVVEEAGMGGDFHRVMQGCGQLHERLKDPFPAQAAYPLGLAWRVRYSIEMNAREAMHLIELRSSPQGHPIYRSIAQEMHRLIRDGAGHRTIASSMSFVDLSEGPLGRLSAEEATLRKAATE